MKNSRIIIGIDEVGRGPLAGPLVVGTVALDNRVVYEGLADSKQLSPKRRLERSIYVKGRALGIGLGWVDASRLDRIGITRGLKLATRLAYRQLPSGLRDEADNLVIDGNINLLDDSEATVLVKADAKVQAVSAASIVAKVARDHYMSRLAELYPGYGFERHMGYGTRDHLRAIRDRGVIPGVHRLSFRPVRQFLGEEITTKSRSAQTAGQLAEAEAANYLVRQGYTIVDRNWRTKYCEVDIIAKKSDRIYFVEVKYREVDRHGKGLDAITPAKLRQMHLGAEMYLLWQSQQCRGLSPQLMAMSLSGTPPQVDDQVAIV